MIRIKSISPERNKSNVSTNEDIKIIISSDFKLDPRDVIFSINGVDVIPSVYPIALSVDSETCTFEMSIIFHSRRRIRFGNTYHYGQEAVRYGMNDIHPSALEYGSRYVCAFKVWGVNSSLEKEEFNSSFVFTTEEGVFFNAQPADYFYSDFTQSMSNRLPEWAKGRYDKYSNFQQLLNPIGEILEKTQDFVNKVYQGSNIQSVDLKELSCLYKYELDKKYEFKTFLNQDGSSLFVQPSITGSQGITSFDLFATEENSLRSLSNNRLPSRITAQKIKLKNNQFYQKTLVSDLKFDVNVKLEREGSFVIYCKNLTSSITRESLSTFVIAKCQVKGISIFNKEQEEEIILYNEKFLFTKKLWKKVISVQFFNVNQDDVTFELMHFPDSSKTCPDTKKIFLTDGSMDLAVWSIEKRSNSTILQKRKNLGKTKLEMLKTAGANEPFCEFGLYDTDNATPLELIDIAVDYNSNYIYGISKTYLYIFDKREPYPSSLKKIPNNSQNPDLVLRLETDGLFMDENNQKEILVNVVHVNPGKKIIKYRIKITKPDGLVVYLLRNGTTTADVSKSPIFVTQDSYVLKEIANRFYASEPGEYLFEIEALYQGGTTSKDYSFIYIPKICAIAKYKLDRILGETRPVGIFKDFDQEIKIYAGYSDLYTIIFHRDGIVIDYTDKIVYSSEKYDLLDVE